MYIKCKANEWEMYVKPLVVAIGYKVSEYLTTIYDDVVVDFTISDCKVLPAWKYVDADKLYMGESIPLTTLVSQLKVRLLNKVIHDATDAHFKFREITVDLSELPSSWTSDVSSIVHELSSKGHLIATYKDSIITVKCDYPSAINILRLSVYEKPPTIKVVTTVIKGE